MSRPTCSLHRAALKTVLPSRPPLRRAVRPQRRNRRARPARERQESIERWRGRLMTTIRTASAAGRGTTARQPVPRASNAEVVGLLAAGSVAADGDQMARSVCGRAVLQRRLRRAGAASPRPGQVWPLVPQRRPLQRPPGGHDRRRPASRPARHGRITPASLHWMADLAARNAQQSEPGIRVGRYTGSDLRFWWAGTGSNRRPCSFQSLDRVCSDAEIRCLRCSLGIWQGKPEQGMAGFSLTATLTADAQSLVAESDLLHERDQVVEEVLLHDLSVVPAGNGAEVHLERPAGGRDLLAVGTLHRSGHGAGEVGD
jgi:hypothetical protein